MGISDKIIRRCQPANTAADDIDFTVFKTSRIKADVTLIVTTGIAKRHRIARLIGLIIRALWLVIDLFKSHIFQKITVVLSVGCHNEVPYFE